jgi:REP element-mobilizing transposase RayT
MLSKPDSYLDFESYQKLLLKYESLMETEDHGVKYLEEPQIAEICKNSLHFYDEKEFTLICYCIMPNHIHLVFELIEGNQGISKIMQSIKGFSARESNKILNRSGAFWNDESFDRLIRNKDELFWNIRYVLINPVSAGLVEDWKQWKYTYCHPDFMII